LADIGIALAELAAGRPHPRAYVADPGLGKTAMLGALLAAAQEAGRPTRWLRADQLTALGDVAAAPPPDGVVVVDDLHRLPVRAVPALERLLASAAPATLVAVGYRPRQAAPEVTAALQRSDPLLQIRPLAPLSLIDAEQVLGHPSDLAELHRRAEGNPLYLRLLAERPSDHDAAVRAELAELSPVQLSLAQAASVVGNPFTPETLLRVAAVEDATAGLDALLTADVLRLNGSGPLQVLRHSTVGAVAYQMMTVGQRAELHLRADRELERRGAGSRRTATTDRA
jgi:hypothetical protein